MFEKRIKGLLLAAVWVITLGFFASSVVLHVFGGTIWDLMIYAVGSLVFGCCCSYGIMLVSAEKIKECWKDEGFWKSLIQIICFALISVMTLYYYNSGSEYGHSVATRIMNSAFGIALLLMYDIEERMNKKLLLVQSIAGICAVCFSLYHAEAGKMLVLRALTVLTVWVYARLLGCFAARCSVGKLRKNINWYGILVFLFLLGIVVFRNTRTWPFSVAIPFVILYLHDFKAGEWDTFLRNYCYGCILAFWLMFGSAALFRPYYSFEFIRYPNWFSSVATAGLFWMLVFSCCLCCILSKIKAGEQVEIRKIYFELITLGAVSSYLLMTLSRTAALSTAVFSLLAFVCAEAFYYRDNLGGMLKKILIVVLPVFIVFPMVYTITRCVPALVARPVWITGAEWFSDRIEKKEPMDSTKYMNLPQLGETFLEKWLGIDMNLTEMAGSVSGPGENTNGNDNVVGMTEIDGQLYTVKDYSFHNTDTDDVSNGRFDLFHLYYSHLNWTGHDSMLVQDVDDSIALYHAHNSYMQVAFDHGIAVGILFIALVVLAFPMGIWYYYRNCRQTGFAIYPVVVVLSFMIAGLTEWIFHPSIPIGFAFLMALTPLVAFDKKREKQTDV